MNKCLFFQALSASVHKLYFFFGVWYFVVRQKLHQRTEGRFGTTLYAYRGICWECLDFYGHKARAQNKTVLRVFPVFAAVVLPTYSCDIHRMYSQMARMVQTDKSIMVAEKPSQEPSQEFALPLKNISELDLWEFFQKILDSLYWSWGFLVNIQIATVCFSWETWHYGKWSVFCLISRKKYIFNGSRLTLCMKINSATIFIVSIFHFLEKKKNHWKINERHWMVHNNREWEICDRKRFRFIFEPNP